MTPLPRTMTFMDRLYIRRRVLSGSTDGCAGCARNPGNRAAGDVLDLQARQPVRVQLELAQVGGEDQHAVRFEQRDGVQNQPAWSRCTSKSSSMRLERENVGGSRKMRSKRRPLYSLIHLSTSAWNQFVLTAADAVQLQIALRPVEVRPRHVHGHRRARAAEGGVHRGAAGVAEEIEKALARGHCAQHLRASGDGPETGRCRDNR